MLQATSGSEVAYELWDQWVFDEVESAVEETPVDCLMGEKMKWPTVMEVSCRTNTCLVGSVKIRKSKNFNPVMILNPLLKNLLKLCQQQWR